MWPLSSTHICAQAQYVQLLVYATEHAEPVRTFGKHLHKRTTFDYKIVLKMLEYLCFQHLSNKNIFIMCNFIIIHYKL